MANKLFEYNLIKFVEFESYGGPPGLINTCQATLAKYYYKHCY